MKEILSIEKILEIMKTLQDGHRNMPYMSMIKLVFFAERFHIRNFGFPLTGDMYYAMKHGPVPSVVKNVINKEYLHMGFISEKQRELIETSVVLKDRNQNDKLASFSIKNKSYFDLSKSASASIEFTLINFGSFDQKKLIDITHAYPEWTRYKELFKTDSTNILRQDIFFEDFFKNPDRENTAPLEKHFSGVDPFYEDDEVLKIMMENFFGTAVD